MMFKFQIMFIRTLMAYLNLLSPGTAPLLASLHILLTMTIGKVFTNKVRKHV